MLTSRFHPDFILLEASQLPTEACWHISLELEHVFAAHFHHHGVSIRLEIMFQPVKNTDAPTSFNLMSNGWGGGGVITYHQQHNIVPVGYFGFDLLQNLLGRVPKRQYFLVLTARQRLIS